MVAVVVALTFTPGAPAGPCDGTLCAGAARADITPPVTTPMWGYSARAFYSQPERWAAQRTTSLDTDLYAKALFLRSEGVHTRLYARAIVLRNKAGVKMALVQTDLGAVTGEVHRAVANAVAPLGIARDFLLISATHTHGGPGAVQQPLAHGLLVGDFFDPRVFKRVVDGVIRAVTEAEARLAPSRVGIGQGRILDASVNRSLRAHAGTYDGSPPFNYDPCPDPDAYEADVPEPCDHKVADIDDPGRGETASYPHAIDPTVTVLRVDRADGVPLGVWSSFAAHGTVFYADDLRFSADNQGFAERMIERAVAQRAEAAGVTLPQDWEIVAAYANGTEGDVAPSGAGSQRFAVAEDSGRRQADGVMAVYDGLSASMTDDVALDARWDWLYMTGESGTSPVAILGAGPDCPLGTPPFPDEGVPGQGRKCPLVPLSGTGPNWFGLQVLRIGDVVAAAVPGEITVQMGRRVKKRLLARAPAGIAPIVVGLANDYMAYITTPEEFDVQDYEGTFTLWGRQEGPLVSERLGALADRLFRGEPNPPSITPPDTSWIQAENVSPVSQAAAALPGRAPGTVLSQVAASAERGAVASFAWVGGAPSVEMPPDVAFVETQRRDGDAWETAFWDEGYETILDYYREGLEDRWGIQWDVTMDAPAGEYRFLVHGNRYDGDDVVPYELTSSAFVVTPNDDLSIVSTTPGAGGLRVRAAYPAPVGSDHPSQGQPPPYMHECSAARMTATCNFRWRPAGPLTPSAVLSAMVGGVLVTATGTYLPDEDAYVFPSITTSDVEIVSFVDGFGNST